MGCKASSDKKTEANYELDANADKQETLAKEVKEEIKGEKKALSAESADQLFEIYGVGVTVIAQTLLHIMRGETEAAKGLVAAAGARQIHPGHENRKRDVHPDMLAGVVDLLDLKGVVDGMKNSKDADLEIENTIRMATASWLLGQEFNGRKTPTPDTPTKLFERYIIERYFDDPEGLTMLRVLEQVGLRGHNRHLTARPTPVYHRLHHTLSSRTMECLTEMRGNGTKISEEESISLDVLSWVLRREVEFYSTYNEHEYAINSLNGCHTGLLSLLIDSTPVTDAEDLANYMLRVNGVSKKFKLVIAALKQQIKSGVVPPAFTLENVATKCQELYKEFSEDIKQSRVFTSAFEKLEAAGFKFATADEQTMSYNYLHNAIKKAAKGFKNLNDEITNILADQASSKVGVSDKSYYRWCLREHSELDPVELHNQGLKQVTMIESWLNSCIDRLRSSGTLPASAHVENIPIAQYIRILAEDASCKFEGTDEEKANVVQQFEGLIQEAKERTAHMFSQPPENAIAVSPSCMPTGSPGAVYVPNWGYGLLTATLYVNTEDLAPALPKFMLRTHVAHDAVPGHHYATSYANGAGVPLFQKTAENFAGYHEGWALYAERLTQEAHFFATEADNSEGFDLLGMLSLELLHAARLVVDTGIHHSDWTREHAISYLTEHTGLSQEEVLADVDRIAVMPAQSLAEKVGQLTILNLRSWCQEKKGDDFSLPEFHDAVLGHGAMPLSLLESTVKAIYNKVPEPEPDKEVYVPEVSPDAPPHVMVAETVNEDALKQQEADAQKLHDQYPDLHHALRENGLMGQRNDGMQYMDYVLAFVHRGITRADQLKDVDGSMLNDIGLTPMEQRLYKRVFHIK